MTTGYDLREGSQILADRRVTRHAGGPCAKRRYGCRGKIIIESVSYRDNAGQVTRRMALCCNRCGQGYGLAQT